MRRSLLIPLLLLLLLCCRLLGRELEVGVLLRRGRARVGERLVDEEEEADTQRAGEQEASLKSCKAESQEQQASEHR